MTNTKKKTKMTAAEFDHRFENSEEILSEFDQNTTIKKINVDFPMWMVKILDEESMRLGIPRQAIIKTWINDRIESNLRQERRTIGT
jgi:hypothetical protein